MTPESEAPVRPAGTDPSAMPPWAPSRNGLEWLDFFERLESGTLPSATGPQPLTDQGPVTGSPGLATLSGETGI